jgi:two-component system, NarL family, sensor kinase
MMRITLSICLFFLYGVVYTQNTPAIDTLLRRLQNATADSTKAKLYTDLGYQYSDINQAKAFDYLSKAEQISQQKGLKKILCDVYFNKAIAYRFYNKPDSSKYFFEKGIALGEKIDFKEYLIRAHVGLGWYYSGTNEQPKAIKEYETALELAKVTQNISSQADAIRKIAGLQIQTKNLKRGVEKYVEAGELYLSIKDSNSYAEILGSLGYANSELGQPDTAIYYFKKCIALFKQLKNETLVATALTEIGKTYLFNKKYTEAEDYLLQARQAYATQTNHGHYDAMYAYLGQTQVQLGKYAQAKNNLDTALNEATKSHDLEMQVEACKGLYKLYDKQQNYAEAYKYRDKYELLSDSLRTLNSIDELKAITLKFDYEKQQRIIEGEQYKLKKRNLFIASLLGGICLLSLLAYNGFRRYKLKQKTQLQQTIMQQQDKATKAIIAAEENERERIAKELHDGVGQLMSAALMNISAFESESTTTLQQKEKLEKIVLLVDEGCKEVRTVSHNIMPNALLKAGLANALREFINKIDSNVLRIDFYSEGIQSRLDSNIETVLYRVIQECINNVIKHSKANHLDISIIKDDHYLNVTIEDNGQGFDVAKAQQKEGMGLKNMESRIAYLKGTIQFDSQIGKGTVVALHIPLV